MNLTDFTFIVTEKCNFECAYCYQKKGEKDIDISNIKKAVDFFSPFFAEKCHISFYGGEPLLAFELIRETVNYINEKKSEKEIKYSLTTNGSLLDEKIIRFFNRHKFSIRLSFDGLAQEIFRQKSSFNQILSNLKRILKHPGIDFDTNSVFTPETIRYLTKSTRYLVELGVPNVKFSLSTLTLWDQQSLDLLRDELESMRNFLVTFYKKNGSIPVINFRKSYPRGIFACYAGKTRMALAPDGNLWGCFLFWDYYKTREETGGYRKYCFGRLDSFIKNLIKNRNSVYPLISSNYAKLRIDHFCTPDTFCMLCDEMEDCMVCPVDAAFSGAIMGNVPAHHCEINKIERRERRLFREELENKGKSYSNTAS